MDEKKFIKLCKKEIVKYHNEEHKVFSTMYPAIAEDDIYTVWLCKTLQNNKALMSTTLRDGMYYELTYNGDKKELYLDAYKKTANVKIGIVEE